MEYRHILVALEISDDSKILIDRATFFANKLGRVDLCCTFRVQQYIGSHINMNASDNMLA